MCVSVRARVRVKKATRQPPSAHAPRAGRRAALSTIDAFPQQHMPQAPRAHASKVQQAPRAPLKCVCVCVCAVRARARVCVRKAVRQRPRRQAEQRFGDSQLQARPKHCCNKSAHQTPHAHADAGNKGPSPAAGSPSRFPPKPQDSPRARKQRRIANSRHSATPPRACHSPGIGRLQRLQTSPHRPSSHVTPRFTQGSKSSLRGASSKASSAPSTDQGHQESTPADAYKTSPDAPAQAHTAASIPCRSLTPRSQAPP